MLKVNERIQLQGINKRFYNKIIGRDTCNDTLYTKPLEQAFAHVELFGGKITLSIRGKNRQEVRRLPILNAWERVFDPDRKTWSNMEIRDADLNNVKVMPLRLFPSKIALTLSQTDIYFGGV